ncbi:MAG: class I fructose-bisphosphate aldolase [Desulfobacterales bacterium]
MELPEIAKAMVAKQKGILAADESNPTIKKRFDTINVESTLENRNAYRDLILKTDGIEDYISGVILFDETLRSSSRDGEPFPSILNKKGVLPGIKVDQGVIELPGSDGEKLTQGLDGLPKRLKEYYELGARFTKWRAVIKIGENIPTLRCIKANAHALALYAAIVQSAKMVPIVEPEVLMDGNHDIHRCSMVTKETLVHVFFELHQQGVVLEHMLLKPNMVISGLDCPHQADVETVAKMTVDCFKQVLPPALPGVVFLSGGQSAVLATQHLNAMNAMYKNLPWELSFSYGRALQEPTLKAWKGNDENIAEARKKFYHRARCNGLARSGEYSQNMEQKI